MTDQKHIYTIINETGQSLHFAIGRDYTTDIFYINIGETETAIKQLFPHLHYCLLPARKNIRFQLISEKIAIIFFTVIVELEDILYEYPHHKEIIIRRKQKASPRVIQ